MGKIMLALTVFMAMLIPLSAEDSDHREVHRFSMNWNVGFDGQPEAFSRTSVIGFGFTVFHNDRVDIQNQLEFCNGVMIMEDIDTKYYRKVLLERISFGIISGNNFLHPYGFIEGGVGTCGEDLWHVINNPLIGNVGLGAGLEIFAADHWSFLMEIGFHGNIYQSDFIPQQGFQLGTKFNF